MRRATTIILTFLLLAMGLTGAALAWAGRSLTTSAATTTTAAATTITVPAAGAAGGLSLSGKLTQDKIVVGGDGTVSLSLTLSAAPEPVVPVLRDPPSAPQRAVDMVLVLDRSGSMHGEKLRDAKAAILELMAALTPNDRLGLVSYSEDVTWHTGLLPLTTANRECLAAAVDAVMASGGTNLGAGLESGMTMLQQGRRGCVRCPHSSVPGNRVGRVLLISDGMANHGITDPAALGRLAARAVPGEFAVSTVGLGREFNEQTMTAIADCGQGTYHYLETPESFAEVFLKEFSACRRVAAQGLEIRISLAGGLTLLDAAGYPVRTYGNEAVFQPGDLLVGQSRSLFLTLRVPVDQAGPVHIEGIRARFRTDAGPAEANLAAPLLVTRVKNEAEAQASIDGQAWERKVLQEDYNRLREAVAQDVKKGDKSAAKGRIERYRAEKQATNAQVGSAAVSRNLTSDLDALGKEVDETFAAPAAKAEEARQSKAKDLQYKAYGGRRDKN